MDKIYIFSGLGADYRAFKNINFGRLPIEHIKWISPLKDESIENYALRISDKITTDNSILIGLSFGGMMLMEIAKIKKSKKIILIASAKTKNEIPQLYRILGKLKLHKIIPTQILKTTNSLMFWLFGISKKEDKQLLKNIISDTDIDFLKWAINEIVNWKNTQIPNNAIHIHGTKDRIIPLTNATYDYEIQNGGHLMTLNKSKEIEAILIKLCTL